jgi:GH15 family glucan-1,4-alpha-glucosidase
MVVETSWNVGEGWVIVRDALLMGPWRDEDPSASTYRRAPTDYAAGHVLLRYMRCVNGEVQMQLDCEPAFDYGQRRGAWSRTEHGYHEAVVSAPGQPQLRLTTDLRLGFEGPRAVARTLLKEGEVRFCALSWGAAQPPRDAKDAYQRLVWTAHHWQHWLAGGRIPDHRWRRHVSRSALTLKGLTYAPTGAIAAAATTSLPESPGGERNWDYRYSWIRDATFALWGLYTLGFDWEANDFFHFITDVAERDGELQIVYGVGGETDLTERELPHLNGYGGARPVRIGNGAYRQRQNDVWGAMLDSAYLHTRSRDRLDDRSWQMLQRQVESALAHWREPDHGIWEIRGEPQHFTSSKVMCWVAADRGARLARLREDWERADRWQAAADEMHADICTHAVDSRGVFTQHYGTDALDASMLLMPLVRFLPAADPRVRATVLAIADELTDEGLVLRYRVKETDDGFSEDEGTFTICSFWLVSALAEIGETARARQLCEKMLGYASPLLLFAEELDPRTGRHLGNFPQAFTHLALINAVMHVIRLEQADGLDGDGRLRSG